MREPEIGQCHCAGSLPLILFSDSEESIDRNNVPRNYSFVRCGDPTLVFPLHLFVCQECDITPACCSIPFSDFIIMYKICIINT